MIEVRPLDERDDSEYTEFLSKRPDGLLYHSFRYRNLLCEHLGCRAEYLGAFIGGQLVGALPIMWLDHESGRIANSLPFYGSNGAVIADDPDVADRLMGEWDDRATDTSTLAATIVTNPMSTVPIKTPHHDMTDDRINQATPLPNCAPSEVETTIMSVIDSSARRNVKKAQRVGVVADTDVSAITALAGLHQDNMAEIGGRAKQTAFFDLVPQHFEAGTDYDVYVGRMQDQVVAALLVFWFGQTAEYFTPAVHHDYRADQPMAAILLRALTDAVQRGFKLWNWGGTWKTQSGVYRFKRKWGARDTPYRYFVKLNDRSILDCTPAELSERFGHFYVVPFSALTMQPTL